MPSTADVGDPGTVFAPNFAVQKRPRIDAIHGPEKRLAHPPKKICLGGGRVSGLSRQTLISGLLPRVEIVESAVSVLAGESDTTKERHLPPSFTSPSTTAQGASLSAATIGRSSWHQGQSVEQDVRRYSDIHAETEAALWRWAASFADPPQDDAPPQPAPNLSVAAAQPVASERSGTLLPVAQVVAALEHGGEPAAHATQAPGSEPAAALEVLAQPAAAQEVAPQPPASQPIQTSSATQTVSSMIQSFAFDDTRSGYSDDYDFSL